MHKVDSFMFLSYCMFCLRSLCACYMHTFWADSSTVAVGHLCRNAEFITITYMFEQVRGRFSVSVSYLFINNALFLLDCKQKHMYLSLTCKVWIQET